MERRHFLVSSACAAATGLLASPVLAQTAPADDSKRTYTRDEILAAGSDFLGVTVEALGGALEKIFADYGEHPTAYIAGEEVSASIGLGVRYGRGNLFMKDVAAPVNMHWQGPSVGFDTGANASRVFSLVYNLRDPIYMYRRFPGVEGSAYFVGGLGVTYQRAEGIVVTPIRAGVGFRLGVNVGYMSFSKKRRLVPL